MVYTVTLNPALDYVMKLKALRTDDINRTDGEEIYYGGKGINVSVILTQLGNPDIRSAVSHIPRLHPEPRNVAHRRDYL